MNYKKILSGFGIAALLVAVQSCDKIKDFKNLNVNPNATTAPITSALLTNVEAGIGGQLGFDAGGINTGSGLYAQYFSETQYTEVSRYNKPSYNYDGYYVGNLEDLQLIIDYNSDPATAADAAAYGSNNDQIAIARILKAHYIKMLTDAVGDLPYFDALKGNQGVISTTYDNQQDIYKDLIKELTEAVNQFDGGAAVQGDIVFGGDITKWKKYANSLRMFLALNMSNVDPATGKTEFAAALAAGPITSNSDNVTINYIGGNFPNPFYNYYVLVQRLDYAESKTMTDQLTSTVDPRLNVYGSTIKGFPYGLTRDNAVAFAGANADWAHVMNSLYSGTNSPYTLIGASNVFLARAEAAQRGWTGENAADMYASGIQANFDQWGLGSAATYLTNGSVALTAGTELQKICTQEWVSFYPNGLEGWDITRRTGYPALTPAPGTTTGIPTRMPYGTNDYSYNAANVADAAARYTVSGIADSQFGKIWWDQ